MAFDWPAFFQRVALHKTLPLRLELRVDRGGTFLLAMLDVPDMHTGAPQTVHHMMRVDDIHSEQEAVWTVHRLLVDSLVHEVDEILLLDGKQLRDPHAKERAA